MNAWTAWPATKTHIEAIGNGKLCIFHLAHIKLDPSKIPLHACNETTIMHKNVRKIRPSHLSKWSRQLRSSSWLWFWSWSGYALWGCEWPRSGPERWHTGAWWKQWRTARPDRSRLDIERWGTARHSLDSDGGEKRLVVKKEQLS